MNKKFGFVNCGNEKRIVAFEDIVLPDGRIIKNGEVGGVLDGTIDCDDNASIWIDTESKMIGGFKIHNSIYLLGYSSYINTWTIPITIGTNMHIEGSHLVDTVVVESKSEKDIISIIYSGLNNVTIKPRSLFDKAGLCYIKTSKICISELSGFFDILSLNIFNCTIHNMRIYKRYDLNIGKISIHNSDIYCSETLFNSMFLQGNLINSEILLTEEFVFDFKFEKLDGLHMRNKNDIVYISNLLDTEDVIFYKKAVNDHNEIWVLYGDFCDNVDILKRIIKTHYKKGDKIRKHILNAIKMAKETIELD